MIGIRNRKRVAAAKDPAPDLYPEDPTDDHTLHLDGQACARCGRQIGADEEARRTARGDYVHMTC